MEQQSRKIADDQFQGVALINLDRHIETSCIIARILSSDDFTEPRTFHDISCFDLALRNKYYTTTVNIFEKHNGSMDSNIELLLSKSEAVIIYADGTKVTTEQLNSSIDDLDSVGGEPRILLCNGIDENCPAYHTIRSWCIEKGYDLIEFGDEYDNKVLIDSLSAYRWSKLKMLEKPSINHHIDNADFMKQIQDFDELIKQIHSFREQPEDDQLMSIAEKLSNLLGEDQMNDLIEESDEESNNNNDADNQT